MVSSYGYERVQDSGLVFWGVYFPGWHIFRVYVSIVQGIQEHTYSWWSPV